MAYSTRTSDERYAEAERHAERDSRVHVSSSELVHRPAHDAHDEADGQADLDGAAVAGVTVTERHEALHGDQHGRGDELSEHVPPE